MVGSIIRLAQVNVLPVGLLPRCLGLLATWHRRATTRAALRDLPPDRLRDIGMTEMDAAREAARCFWEDGK